MKSTKVIFMGTPEFAVPILQTLIDNTEVVLVVTQPDKLVGRNKVLTPPPIKQLALENNIEVFQPTKIREDYERITSLNADLIITCAYGQIIPEEILNNPRLGCINVHASLLPRLRGGAPIHHAIIDGEEKTGITIMYMDKKMDTGDIISTVEYKIKDTDNVGTLHDELSKLGSELLLQTLPSIVDGTNNRTPQNHDEATYAWNIKREEEHLTFNRPSKEILNQIRGLNPWPTANAIILDQEVKILEAYIGEKDSKLSPGIVCEINKDNFAITTNDKIIHITKVKPFGKKIMDARDYINGMDREKFLNSIVK
ncbi:MAG: methionyl-tRNA formyltransferase [Candidatus Coprovivens sp.]